MTGKDLVLYIIKNNLLDANLDVQLRNVFFTVEEAAVKMGISVASLQDMLKLGLIDYLVFDEVIYLHKDVLLTSIKKEIV